MPAISRFVLRGGIIRLAPRLYVSVFSFFALAFFIMGQGVFYSAVFLSAILIHELSHIYFLRLFKAKIDKITIFPFGIDIFAKTLHLSYKKELICTLAGSFANICVSIPSFFIFGSVRHPLILFFALCNLFLGIMNLLPLSFFDGGKAARLIIYDIFDIDKAYMIYRCFETFSGIFFLAVSAFIIKSSMFNFSVVLLVVYASAVSLFKNTRKRKLLSSL